MDKQVKLRIATIQDAAALLDIYAPYVENTAPFIRLLCLSRGAA